MDRVCARCGRGFSAQRASAKYCGSSCRSLASQEKGRSGVVVNLPPKPAREPEAGLAVAVERDLRAARKLESYGGQLALRLAARLEASSVDTGASVAGLSKELDRLMAGLLADVPKEPDALDEIQARVVQLRTQRRA